jgi:serine/threonine protein kinase
VSFSRPLNERTDCAPSKGTPGKDVDHAEPGVSSLNLQGIEPAPVLPAIPGYALFEKIGEGATGQVYRGEHKATRQSVAVKIFEPLPTGQPPLDAVQRESRLVAALSHPHVIAVYESGCLEESGQPGGRYYLVMEYVPGTSLRAQMQPGRPLPLLQAWPIINAIAQALSHVHEKGILHLDLKPENVLCSERGGIKITDFGLAIAHLDPHARSEGDLRLGSIDYCAPEQRHGMPLDRRSDLFSLATITYELLTGHLPGRVYVPATKRNASLPQDIDAVLCKGLARDADERYASVEEFHADLARTLAHLNRRESQS